MIPWKGKLAGRTHRLGKAACSGVQVRMELDAENDRIQQDDNWRSTNA
jgi:hypothetical protein